MTEKSNKLKRLNYSISAIESIYHDAACKFGISDSTMMILYTVSFMGGKCLLRDIYTLSGVRKQTINSAIRRLENDEMIYLENHNGKSKKVCFTDKGKNFADKTVVPLISAENRILESWSESDADLYIELTRRYAEDLKAQLNMLSEVEK